MTSISQTLNSLLDGIDAAAEANNTESTAGSVNAGDSKLERSLEESKAANEESDTSSIGCISDTSLPSLGDRCNDP